MNVLSKNIKTIAEALARHIFNLSLVVSCHKREGGKGGGGEGERERERERGGGEKKRAREWYECVKVS